MQKIKDFIYYNRKDIIIFLIFLILFIISQVKNSIESNKNDEIIVEKEIVKECDEVVEKEENSTVVIDIKGEVNNPGTYELDDSKRIVDAIEKAGGLKENADTSYVNLSEKLIDEMLIYIPKFQEESQSVEYKNYVPEVKENKTVKDSKISINSASIEELMTINGIGKSKATNIVNYRNKNGKFKKLEDLLNVSGIGNSTFEKIKDYIKL